jgi:hypothetical protein
MQNGQVVASGSTDEMLDRYHGKTSAPASTLVHETDEAIS